MVWQGTGTASSIPRPAIFQVAQKEDGTSYALSPSPTKNPTIRRLSTEDEDRLGEQFGLMRERSQVAFNRVSAPSL
jgi:hypothetical protein